MRWGVRDEMTNEHMTTALCMTELRNCQRLSMGPNFIYFGAQKYGYRLVMSGIKYTLLYVFKKYHFFCKLAYNETFFYYKGRSRPKS